MSLAFKVFALSDLGLVREGNEDSGLISSKLVAVADGMGGHAGGEVASTIAITALTAKQIDEDSLLTHALMGDSGFDPVVQLYPIKLGDQFLLCSDGLTGVLSDFEITKIIKKYDGQELVENLVAETRAKGAPDNVTVIWAEVVLEKDASSTSLIGAAHA